MEVQSPLHGAIPERKLAETIGQYYKEANTIAFFVLLEANNLAIEHEIACAAT